MTPERPGMTAEQERDMALSGMQQNERTIERMEVEVAALRAERDRLRDALDEWKCPACGGAGTYQQKGEATGYEHVTVLCRKCDGSGLHPIARAAL